METEALRQQVLNKAGIPIDFGSFDFKVIPGFEMETFYTDSGNADITKQNFKFQALTSDVKNSGVKSGDTFILSDDTYDMTFTVEGLQPDLTGWHIISAAFISMVES